MQSIEGLGAFQRHELTLAFFPGLEPSLCYPGCVFRGIARANLAKSSLLQKAFVHSGRTVHVITNRTSDGDLVIGELLEEALALSCRGGSRLLSSIIAGLEEMTELADDG